MGRVKVRWLIKRSDKKGARFYWYPPRRMQERYQFLPRALGADEGEAIKKAIDLNAAADRRVAEGVPGLPADKVPGSWGWLIDTFERDDAFRRLRDSTQRYYREEFKHVRALLGDLPILGTSRADVKTIYNSIKYDEGLPRKAEKIVRTIQRLYAFAHDLDASTFGPSPYLRLSVGHAKTEKRRWSADDVESFCVAAVSRKADQVSRPSIRLAVRLARFAAMREIDVLTATDAHVVRPVVDFSTGARLAEVGIRKETTKRGVKIVIPITDETLAAEIIAAAGTPGPLIRNETTGEAWNQRLFQQTFASIRRAAGLPTDLIFKNLRHTRLQEAGDAGASRDQIRSLAGHDDPKSAEAYVWPSAAQALGAIDAVDASKQRNKRRAKLNGSPEKS